MLKKLLHGRIGLRGVPPFLGLLLCLESGPVYASACSNPAGNEGDLQYNKDYHTYQFCNGTSWVVAGGTVAPEATGTQTIGDASVEATSDSGNANELWAQKATLSY